MAAVAALMPYWGYFEGATSGDLRGSRADLLEQVVVLLAEIATVEPLLWIDSPDSAARAADELMAADADAVVVVQTMAVPPAWTAAALEAVPNTPVVLAAVQDRESPGEGFDHGAIVDQGSTVGAAQLGNVLVRRGRRFRLVAGHLGDAQVRGELRREVSAARAVGRLRGARMLRVGAPLEGYECVDCDAEQLRAAVGVELVEIQPEELRATYRDVDDAAVQAIFDELDASWTVELNGDSEALDRSVRMAAALESLGRDRRAAAGALNCHVPALRLGDDPGVAPCFALGRETSQGRPWTCTGDVVTAVAMLALKHLGLGAWYHEIEALDHATDEALLACSGEHDLALAGTDQRPLLHANPWWNGACACFTPPPGPATLLAFTPAQSGFRFIVAEGEFTERRLTGTGTVNAAFRFTDGPVREAWARWATAGANHHGAATHGHHAEAVHAMAEHLDVDWIPV